MRSYFAIELTPGPYGGGYFEGKASFRLDNLKLIFNKVPVKIDTGCSTSTIPIRKLGVSKIVCNKIKEKDIRDNRKSVLSYGIETGGNIHFKPVTKHQQLKCPALKFEHTIYDFEIEGVKIPISSIYLNYDRSSNILIGMDILEKMVTYIDISKKNGKLMLFSAPRENVDSDFCYEMKNHFGVDIRNLQNE